MACAIILLYNLFMGNQLQNVVTLFSQIFCSFGPLELVSQPENTAELFSVISVLLKSSWETKFRIRSHFFLEFLVRQKQVGKPTSKCGHTFFLKFLVCKKQVGKPTSEYGDTFF